MKQQFRYRLLQYLPGARGRRYSRKYKSVLALDEFEAAISQSAGKTCIDLGANVGHYTRKMSSVAREVIAFEPDPWAIEHLRNNLGESSNVRIEHAAASTRNGIGVLWRRAQFDDDPLVYSTSSTLVKGKILPVSSDQAVEVKLVDFIQYLDGLGTGCEIGVIKMDIEGEELDILDALLSRRDLLARIEYIFAETHERQIPDQKERVFKLRARIANVHRPRINLDWN